MKTKFFFFLFLFIFFQNKFSSAQSFIITTDTTVCVGQPVRLHAYFDTSFTTLGLDSIDDVYSQAINIGFPFTFYGNTYTQCTLSSNAYISFDTSYFTPPGASFPNFSPYTISNAIPSNANPLNSIFGVWHDVDPSVSPFGIRTYLRTGIAPNRKFVFSFCNVPMFQCNNLIYTGQIILYEGSNDIEVHVGSKVLCTGWNVGAAIIGVQDATGSTASFPAGYNYPTQWTATNQSWRFIWNNAISNYNNMSIPYNPVPVNIGGTWVANGNIVGTDTVITVNPTTTTTYYVSSLGCAGSTTDSVKINVINIAANTTVTNSNCNNSTPGNIIANLTSSFWPLNFNWYNVATSANMGSMQMTATNHSDTLQSLLPGQYAYTIIDTFGCNIIDTLTVSSGNFPVINFTQKNTNCPNDATGYAACLLTNNTFTYTFNWMDVNHNTVQLHTKNTNDTLFNITAGTYYVTVNTGPFCFEIDTITILTVPFNPSFTFNNYQCAKGLVNFNSTSIGSVANYVWKWGDATPYTLGNPAFHTFANAGTYQVTMIIQGAGGCVDSITHAVTVLKNITAQFVLSPTNICIGQAFTSLDNSDQHPLTWQWFFGDGNSANTAHTASHSYTSAGSYTVNMIVNDSLCGSDSIKHAVTVLPPPSVSLGSDVFTCLGTTVSLTASSSASIFLWSNNLTTPIIAYTLNTDTALIWVEVTNAAGCTNRDTMLLVSDDCVAMYPNSFSPNGDGNNDVFRILAKHVTAYDLKIFNRWGNIVYNYSGTDVKAGWDGKFNNQPQETGAYIYFSNATLLDGKQLELKGNLVLIR